MAAVQNRSYAARLHNEMSISLRMACRPISQGLKKLDLRPPAWWQPLGGGHAIGSTVDKGRLPAFPIAPPQAAARWVFNKGNEGNDPPAGLWLGGSARVSLTEVFDHRRGT